MGFDLNAYMLDNVRQQFVSLVSAYETEKARRCKLEQENKELAEKLEAYGKQITELETKYDNLKLTAAFVGSSADSSESRKKIEMIVKELVKCLSLLNS